jgi:hypothetical protein
MITWNYAECWAGQRVGQEGRPAAGPTAPGRPPSQAAAQVQEDGLSLLPISQLRNLRLLCQSQPEEQVPSKEWVIVWII